MNPVAVTTAAAAPATNERQLARSAIMVLRHLTSGLVSALDGADGKRAPDLSNLDPLRMLVLQQLKSKLDTYRMLRTRVERRDLRRIVLFLSLLNVISILQSTHNAVWKLRNRARLTTDEAYASGELKQTDVDEVAVVLRMLAAYVSKMHWVRTVAMDRTGHDSLVPPEELLRIWPIESLHTARKDYFVGGDRSLLVQMLRLALDKFATAKEGSIRHNGAPDADDNMAEADDEDEHEPAATEASDEEIQDSQVFISDLEDILSKASSSFTANAWADDGYREKYIRRTDSRSNSVAA